jgi:hypothetical protein
MNTLYLKFVILQILFFVSINLISQPTPPKGQVWIPVSELTDEFNESSLDRNKWLDYHPYWKGREPSQFDPENVSVSEGCLKLKSIVSNYSQSGNWIASSCVSSKTKAMKQGYYSEARIKCPELSMTGAFWFQGNYSEIDVIENFGAPTAIEYAGYETSMNVNTHYFAGGWDNDIETPWSDKILQASCANSFFTYGVWWKDQTTIIFYLDGMPVHTATPGGLFDEDMYMFFDMEAFSWGIGLPTISSLDDSTKNTQYIDWVRTYKLVSDGTSIYDIVDSIKVP